MDQELFKFRAIIGDQDPLAASDPDWKGSKYNVQVEGRLGRLLLSPSLLVLLMTQSPVQHVANNMISLL